MTSTCVCVYIYVCMYSLLNSILWQFSGIPPPAPTFKKKKKKIFGGFFSQTYHICGALKFQNDLPTKIAYKFL